MNASGRLLKALLERGDYLERLSLAETRQAAAILDQAHEAVLGRIAATRSDNTRAWLQQVAADIRAIYAQAAARLEGELTPRLRELSADEAAWIAERGRAIIPDVIQTTAPSPEQVWAAATSLPASGGMTLSELMQAMGVAANRDVIEALQVGIVGGETNDQLVQRLRGRVIKRASWRTVDGQRRYVPGKYEGGVMTANTRQAELLARTATMHVANVARESYFEANDDIIRGVMRVATLDMDTCLICGSADGVVYETGEPRPALPVHPNCRCTYVPVLKPWQELGIDLGAVPPGTRASMDGQVPENETFETRLEKMSPERQAAILGPTRLKLWQDGMPLRSMVENDTRLIPVKELLTRS